MHTTRYSRDDVRSNPLRSLYTQCERSVHIIYDRGRRTTYWKRKSSGDGVRATRGRCTERGGGRARGCGRGWKTRTGTRSCSCLGWRRIVVINHSLFVRRVSFVRDKDDSVTGMRRRHADRLRQRRAAANGRGDAARKPCASVETI